MTTIKVRVGDVIEEAYGCRPQWLSIECGELTLPGLLDSPVETVAITNMHEATFRMRHSCDRRIIGNVLDLAKVTAKWPKKKGGHK